MTKILNQFKQSFIDYYHLPLIKEASSVGLATGALFGIAFTGIAVGLYRHSPTLILAKKFFSCTTVIKDLWKKYDLPQETVHLSVKELQDYDDEPAADLMKQVAAKTGALALFAVASVTTLILVPLAALFLVAEGITMCSSFGAGVAIFIAGALISGLLMGAQLPLALGFAAIKLLINPTYEVIKSSIGENKLLT